MRPSAPPRGRPSRPGGRDGCLPRIGDPGPDCGTRGDARVRDGPQGPREALPPRPPGSPPHPEAHRGLRPGERVAPRRPGQGGDALARVRPRSRGPRPPRPDGAGRDPHGDCPGRRPASAGHPVRLWQTARPVTRPGRARREGTPGGPLADVGRSRPLALDEFGHVPPARAARGCCSRSYPRATGGGAPYSPRTQGSRGGARSSPTTSWRRQSSTASRATAGSWGSEGPATGSRRASCWAGREGRGICRCARDETRKIWPFGVSGG